MRRAIRAGLLVVAAIALAVGTMTAVGATLPVAHRAIGEAVVRAPRDSVFAAIADVERYPAWRSGVDRVDHRAEVGGRRVYVEHGSDGAIPYEVVSQIPGRQLVTRIVSDDLPFGGTWTFDLSDAEAGTIVRITEDGEVYNPFFRFMSRYVFGHRAGIDRYLADLVRLAGV